MNCKTCPVRVYDFVHSDLYCRQCKYKPAQKTKAGIAYLFRKGDITPVCSVEIKARADMMYEVAAYELMRMCRIEVTESDSRKLAETILGGMR